MSLEWVLLILRALAIAVLYGFLAVVVYIIWRDLRSAVRDVRSLDAVLEPPSPLQKQGTTVGEPSGRVRIVANGDNLSPGGGVFTLSSPLTIGRAADNHVVLADDLASLRHARIDRHDEEWWLTDLDSRNGTRLNDVLITRPVPLADGDVVGIGSVRLKFEVGNPN
jgi:pSer/pThr/pTyr-binding forkhead associated (FHA) protein